MTFLKELLSFYGIDPERLRIRQVSSAEAAEYVEELTSFVETVRKIGPNPLTTRIKEEIAAS